LSLRPKQGIANIKTGTHGGINRAELKALGIDPEAALDFSICTNPFLPPGIRERLGTIPIERYPDSESAEFRQALSENLGIPAENILAGSGTTELIRLITLTYFRRGDPVLLLEPTYDDYEIASRIAGARLIKHRAREEDGFAPRPEEVAGLIRKHRPRGIFIGNPNNPTGKYLSRREIETVLEATEDGLLVLDEAYIAFVEKGWHALDLTARGNIIILRSMTKEYGIPGLRLGYAVADREIIGSLHRVCPPWNVNIIAQQVGVAVLQQKEYLRQSLRQIREAKQYLSNGLSQLGFKVLPSDAHYFLVRVGHAREFRNSMLRHGIIVRDGSSFGLPEYVRISPRPLPECERLIAAIKTVQQQSRASSLGRGGDEAAG
jgi:histidinol-phosphate aminotransferase